MDLIFNNKQTPISENEFSELPKDVREQFIELINGVPFIHSLIAKDRPRAKDLPRDDKGRIIVDIVHPHILEDMDYFRPAAIHFEKYGCYTKLRPNGNPNSEYMKWVTQELDRIWNGMVRPSDGEWIPGILYFYWNYSIIQTNEVIEGTKKANRVENFPKPWDSTYLWAHYIHQAMYGGKYNNNIGGEHFGVIARRGCGKSIFISSLLARAFICGENSVAREKVKSYVFASDKQFLMKDGTLNKFLDTVNFCADHTQFPHLRLIERTNDMYWVMGYLDAKTKRPKGVLNEVMGVSIKDQPDKIRGKRGMYTFFEEFGYFKNFLQTFNTARYNVEDGDISFGTMGCIGTGGTKGADFAGALEMIYHPHGFKMYGLPNVFDIAKGGMGDCMFFIGAYLNRSGCYDKDGNSDVIKALIQVLNKRHLLRVTTSDPSSMTQAKAEDPLTIQDCIMQTKTNIYPVADLNDRITELTVNPHALDDVYVGKLNMTGGKVEFQVTGDTPIRQYPLKDNKAQGALEIYMMPEINKATGEVFHNRYLLGADTYDNDVADSLSLGSVLVLDAFTDKLVAEYTGRPPYADDFYEICRRLCLFYNGKLCYEAHPYSQPVTLANSEVTTWEHVSIGTELLAPNGKTVKVVDIPVHKYMPIYKVTLNDDRVVYASDNHIWSVYTQKDRKKPVLRTTSQMMETGVKNSFNQSLYFIPNGGLVHYPKIAVPIDPYTMGLLLAEGCFVPHHCHKNTIQISASIDDLNFYKENIPYVITHRDYDKFNHTVHIDNCKAIMSSLNLFGKKSYNKFIPDAYLYNDKETRMELLQGLMDGDGCANIDGARIFVTTSEQLSIDIMTLCRSLGMNCKCKLITSKQNNKTFKHYRISIYTNEIIFKLPRKVKRCHTYQMYSKGSKAAEYITKTAIKDIVFSHYEMGKCVTVNSEDGLYLIGDYVVTHNCNKKGLYSYFSKTHSLYLLTDTFSYLRDRDLVKGESFGNTTKGVSSTTPIKNYSRGLIREWLLKPVIKHTIVDGEDVEVSYPQMMDIRNLALLQELARYDTDNNFDRHDALAMLMLYREDVYRLNAGNPKQRVETVKDSFLADSFFDTYDNKLNKKYNQHKMLMR